MKRRGVVLRPTGKDKGLTLIQTMILVAILGLLATGAASLWLKYAEGENPEVSTSESPQKAPGRPSD